MTSKTKQILNYNPRGITEKEMQLVVLCHFYLFELIFLWHASNLDAKCVLDLAIDYLGLSKSQRKGKQKSMTLGTFILI